ncbi:hypothetical protein BDP27DRAFT_1323634 [Rhodocollybia butyracea]|uniref:Uncharacterized protein n=1 Tax=Rhodocollybia butyracea TaxID=206335 RepID=A0A9P5PWG1_9AGAR|nr:hypothetical protein BDP27DRAFT_1323634 [Rhodocollybia butyracea]
MRITPRIHCLGLFFFSVLVFAVHGMPTRGKAAAYKASARKTMHREPTAAQKEYVVTILNETFEPIEGVTRATKSQITQMIKEKFKLQHVEGLRMDSIMEYKTETAKPHENGFPAFATQARFVLQRRNDKHLHFGISADPNGHQEWKPYRWHTRHEAYETEEVKSFDTEFLAALNKVSLAEWEKRVKDYQERYRKPKRKYKPKMRKTISNTMAAASGQFAIPELNHISAEQNADFNDPNGPFSGLINDEAAWDPEHNGPDPWLLTTFSGHWPPISNLKSAGHQEHNGIPESSMPPRGSPGPSASPKQNGMKPNSQDPYLMR